MCNKIHFWLFLYYLFVFFGGFGNGVRKEEGGGGGGQESPAQGAMVARTATMSLSSDTATLASVFRSS